MNDVVLRVLVLIPWILPIYLIAQAIDGEMSGLLVFTLVVILVPLIILVNLITVVVVKGRAVFKAVVKAQKQAAEPKSTKRVEATNYADLPWYDIRGWFK